MNNIFDKKRNNIFYTPINGEVYECKFNSVCIKVSGCTDNALLGTGIISLNMDNYMFPIISMSLILADSTEPVDATSGVFSPTKIYRTFDDCIKDNNPLFRQDETYGLLLNTCVIFDTIAGEFTPKKAFWATDNNSQTGETIYRLFTYRWSNFDANVCYFGGENRQDEDYSKPIYDLVNDKWFVKDGYYDKCYFSYKACNDANPIKIHRLYNRK